MKRAITSLLSLTPVALMAQESSAGFVETYQQEIIMGLVVAAVLTALLATIIAYVALRAVLGFGQEETESKGSFWENFYTNFNRAQPEEQVMTSHEYDGIKELDNRLPPWWLYGFYFTILFGIVYLLHFHVLGTGKSSHEEYIAEMEQAEAEVQAYLAEQGSMVDETNVVVLTEDADLQAGEEMFLQNCSACHGQQGQGGIGPNFADNYWIHGGSVADVFTVIKYGVPEKGMISWESQFSPVQMQQLASYILTMPGTNPPNQKEPQGELYEPAESDSTSVSEDEPITL